jgi:Holliday junction resolvase RusA-like endonuclease
MHFILVGKFKPAVRMTQRSKHADPQAQEYLASKTRLGYQLRQQMDGAQMFPRGVPLSLSIKISSMRGYNNCDLSNQLKALEDAANQIVYADDCWVDEIYARRDRGDANTIIFDVAPLDERTRCPCCGQDLGGLTKRGKGV